MTSHDLIQTQSFPSLDHGPDRRRVTQKETSDFMISNISQEAPFNDGIPIIIPILTFISMKERSFLLFWQEHVFQEVFESCEINSKILIIFVGEIAFYWFQSEGLDSFQFSDETCDCSCVWMISVVDEIDDWCTFNFRILFNHFIRIQFRPRSSSLGGREG